MTGLGQDLGRHAAAASRPDDDDIRVDHRGFIIAAAGELEECKVLGLSGLPVDGDIGVAGDAAEEGVGLEVDGLGDDGEGLEEDAGGLEPGGVPALEDGFADVDGLVLEGG